MPLFPKIRWRNDQNAPLSLSPPIAANTNPASMVCRPTSSARSAPFERGDENAKSAASTWCDSYQLERRQPRRRACSAAVGWPTASKNVCNVFRVVVGNHRQFRFSSLRSRNPGSNGPVEDTNLRAWFTEISTGPPVPEPLRPTSRARGFRSFSRPNTAAKPFAVAAAKA